MSARSFGAKLFSIDDTASREHEHCARSGCVANTRTPRSWNRRYSSRSPDKSGSISSTSSTVADQRLALGPGVVLRHGVNDDALRRIAGMQIGLAGALRRLRQELQQHAAGAPVMLRARRRRAIPRRPRAAPGSESAPSAGNIHAPHLPGYRLQAHQSLVAAHVRRPDRWSSRDGRGRAARRSPVPSRSRSRRSAHRRAAIRGRKSTIINDTGPSVWVCRMKRPSNFSDEPSNVVSTMASPSSLRPASG